MEAKVIGLEIFDLYKTDIFGIYIPFRLLFHISVVFRGKTILILSIDSIIKWM